MISQHNISASTPMGANLVAGGGATFRAWGPLATEVFVTGEFGGLVYSNDPNSLMAKDTNGYWTGFVPEAREGDLYRFWVNGPGSKGFKRDPYARELARDNAFPNCSSIIRRSNAYPWHDGPFVTPDFTNMVIYQLHIGTYAISQPGAASNFLDVIGKVPYLVDLGINVLQPLPVDEVETNPSLGYAGADLFSPDFPYGVTDPGALSQYLARINGLLTSKSLAPLSLQDIQSGPHQLKAMVDLCHVYGIAVAFDVVYNHAGGFSVNGQPDDNCVYYWDRAVNRGNNNDSLYFTDQDRGTGGLSFALWKQDVRQFLLNNALYYIEEFHADGFRYDEISDLLDMNGDSGWLFCRNLTDTVRYVKPHVLQNAEFWPGEVDHFPRSTSSVVNSTASGGGGFDVVQHDALRNAVRGAVRAASFGAAAAVDMDAIAGNLFAPGLQHGWQAVTCVENHDIVKVGSEPRIPFLADSSNRRSWYARSRSRFATGILLTAPGIPHIFMGQEFLEDKQWSWDPNATGNLLYWDGILNATDPAMVDFARFAKELIRLRWNQPALRGEKVNPYYVHNADRVIAFHRWLEGIGADVVIAATLSDTSWYGYSVGFPYSGPWRELFNSDFYDSGGNPQVVGNGGRIVAAGPPMHGFTSSAAIVIPANGFIVFAHH